MTSRNHFDDSLRWRAVHRLKADQSQVKVARWLQVPGKWSSGYGINLKQVVLSPGMSTKFISKHRHLHTITTWHFVSDDISEQRLLSLLTTLQQCLEEEVSAK
ncbi:hypothetical protein TNCV_3630321 [Trichonephila clavipes]|nr:hypothetical protein TNCV_3630321 [Trichonephila clavipes]